MAGTDNMPTNFCEMLVCCSGRLGSPAPLMDWSPAPLMDCVMIDAKDRCGRSSNIESLPSPGVPNQMCFIGKDANKQVFVRHTKKPLHWTNSTQVSSKGKEIVV